MLNSLPVRLLWHSLNWLTRLTIMLGGVLAVLVAFTIIVLRYWTLPDIEQYHPQITASMSRAIGNPVRIGKIQGDWHGWQPRLNFTDVRILDAQGQAALVLPSIDTSVSWMSLLTAELRFASFEIDRPELLIRRDAQGQFFIGGVALLPQGKQENSLADWLLHQSRMVARDALIVWVDEQRAAEPLVLRQVNLHIESLFNHHQFALTALPPEELATPLDVRGDFHGASFDNLKQWRGQIFTQLDYTDVSAWRAWLDLPSEFSHGRGALRGWLGVAAGEVTQITADLDLRDVVTQLGVDVPEMVVSKLRGRAAWHILDGGLEISTSHLAMRLRNGIELHPTDFYFRSQRASATQPATGHMKANLLQLESLVSLANFIPLDEGLRKQLDAYAPRGQVSNLDAQWQGAFDRLTQFTLKGKFNNLAMRQVGKQPGFAGLTAEVDGSESSGTVNIQARQLRIDAPGVMREPLSFASLTAHAGWQRKAGELLISVADASVSNEDLAGNLFGSFQTKAGTLGILDLTASLTRGEIRQAARYTPLVAVDQAGSDWLARAVLAGHTEDFRIRIKGNLSDFPVTGKKDTVLEIGGHARDALIDFDPHWPRIEHAEGDFLIHGNQLEVHSLTGLMSQAQLQNLSIKIDNLSDPELPLDIKGEASASSNNFLAFVQNSPVRGYVNGFTDGMTATGNGHLDLTAHIPLVGTNPVSLVGLLRIQNNDIDMGAGMPLLGNTTGNLAFTEASLRANDVQAEILGGPAHLNLSSASGGVVHADIKGRNNLDALRSRLSHPLLNNLHGGANWEANLDLVNKSVQLVLNSNLQGISSTLPVPFAKRAGEVLPLHLEKKNLTAGQDQITAQLGKTMSVRVLREAAGEGMNIKRGLIDFGGKAKWPAQDGLWVAGALPELSVQGWGGLFKGGAGSGLPVAGINLYIDKLTGYGQTLNNLQINTHKQGDSLVAQLASSVLNGEVSWHPGGFDHNGKLVARLNNLVWGDVDKLQIDAPVNVPKAAPQESLHAEDLPALELSIDNLQVAGKQLGRLDLVGHADGQDWRLRRFNLTNPDGNLVGDGIWHDGKEASMQVNLLLQISDAGKILSRSGYPNTVKNGSGKLAANLSWSGGPDDFDLAKLNGTLKLDTGKGQFLKMDPGIGKLLGVLSLQALPKRITLDFTDVFSDGFQFDNINGNATIKHGVIETQDFHIDGSAAKVTMKGNVDLSHETQNLHIVVLPSVGDSVSLLGAFAAGPVVGLGSLLVNKVLGNPLDKLISFEYNVTGKWVDPSVVKVGTKPVHQ